MIKSLQVCDEAIVNNFKGLKLLDGSGKEREVPVVFISPQKEFKLQEINSMLPCIVVFRNGVYPDVYGWRYDSSTYIIDVEYNEQGLPIRGKEVKSTEPYNIYYGIRIYYEYLEDGADMNFFVTKRTRRGSYVMIDGEGFDLEFLSYKNPEGTYRTFGEVQEKEIKTYQDQYLFKLKADLVLDDTETPVPLNRQTKFNLNTN